MANGTTRFIQTTNTICKGYLFTMPKLAYSAPGANPRTDSDQRGEGPGRRAWPHTQREERRGLQENAAAGCLGCEQGHVDPAGNNYPNEGAANDLADHVVLQAYTAGNCGEEIVDDR